MAPKKKVTSTAVAAASTGHKSLADLRALNASELQVELQSARRQLYILTMKKEQGELKQSHLVKSERRYIAQVSTFLTNL